MDQYIQAVASIPSNLESKSGATSLPFQFWAQVPPPNF